MLPFTHNYPMPERKGCRIKSLISSVCLCLMAPSVAVVLILGSAAGSCAQSTLTTLYNFTDTADFSNAASGANPQGTLYSDGNGNLYGITASGGPTPAHGSVYRYNIASGNLTTWWTTSPSAVTGDGQGNLYTSTKYDLRGTMGTVSR